MTDVAHLNGLNQKEATEIFLQCCGSLKWARKMTEERPFQNSHELEVMADHIWLSLDEEDWLEAFSAHPKIGEKKAVDASVSARWAEDEQSGASRAAAEVLGLLLAANHEYERRFGFIFIVCATGKSAEEMLALLHERMTNEPDAEIRIAVEEQRRITHIRLGKLLT